MSWSLSVHAVLTRMIPSVINLMGSLNKKRQEVSSRESSAKVTTRKTYWSSALLLFWRGPQVLGGVLHLWQRGPRGGALRQHHQEEADASGGSVGGGGAAGGAGGGQTVYAPSGLLPHLSHPGLPGLGAPADPAALHLRPAGDGVHRPRWASDSRSGVMQHFRNDRSVKSGETGARGHEGCSKENEEIALFLVVCVFVGCGPSFSVQSVWENVIRFNSLPLGKRHEGWCEGNLFPEAQTEETEASKVWNGCR